MGPILQWRKLSGDTTRNKDTPWISTQVDNQRASTQENKVKVSRQDFINEDGKRRREESTKKTSHSKNNSERKTHITQHKKAQYTHLVPNERGGLAKNDDMPKVYSSIRKEDNDKKQAKTDLWLNEFTVAD